MGSLLHASRFISDYLINWHSWLWPIHLLGEASFTLNRSTPRLHLILHQTLDLARTIDSMSGSVFAWYLFLMKCLLQTEAVRWFDFRYKLPLITNLQLLPLIYMTSYILLRASLLHCRGRSRTPKSLHQCLNHLCKPVYVQKVQYSVASQVSNCQPRW